LPPSPERKRQLVELDHRALSIRRQCELLGLNRATLYYEPAAETALNLQLMRLMDEQYLKMPFLGVIKLTEWLRGQGYCVNPKRVRRLLRKMGIEAIYPKPKTTKPGDGHKIYPYLLRNLAVTHVNQVWSTDITYLPMPRGFMYLVAVMDWFSRYVLAWQLSNTLGGVFCLDALHQALQWGKPQIFNTDQGVQFTAHAFTDTLKAAGIQISMDGRGRAFDNIFNERLWRSVKYEDVYINDYGSVPALERGLANYFYLYNDERPHQSLNYRTPAALYFS
jgi:putative transposase